MDKIEFTTEILSLDKDKFHIICLQPGKEIDQNNAFTMAQQLSTIVRSNGVDAIILPFLDGKRIDVKTMGKAELRHLKKELLKFKELEEKK